MTTRLVFEETGSETRGGLIVEEDVEEVGRLLQSGAWAELTRHHGKSIWVNANRVLYFHEPHEVQAVRPI